MAVTIPPGQRRPRLPTNERAILKGLLPLLVIATLCSSASAALIPYYRMDSLAFLSSDIVLCDEVQYVKKTRSDGYPYYEATFTVVQALKGACRPQERITVEVDLVYTRGIFRTEAGPGGKAPAIPLGRALLFLTKEDKVWQPVSMKLIMNGETYCYGQFLTNPGPLYLARMAPENFDLPPTTPYSEELLLKDLEAAQEKAKKLTKASAGQATSAVIRKTEPPKSRSDEK